MYKDETALMDMLVEEKQLVDEFNRTVLEKRLMFAKAESCEDASDEFQFMCAGNDLARECTRLKEDLHTVRYNIGRTISNYIDIK